MGQIRIIVDLPGDSLRRALHRHPYTGYDSVKLKDLLERRLRSEFPNVMETRVEIIANNIFFGIDVMGDDLDEIADVQERLPKVVRGAINKLKC